MEVYDSRKSGMRRCGVCRESYPGLSVDDVLKKIKDLSQKPSFALAYTPDFCGFVVCGDDAFCSLGEEKPVENIFELRCFCKAYELRWAREGNTGKGRAVLLCDSESGLSLPGAKCEDGIQALEGEYLLWGQGERRGETVRLFEHRVGELPVPLEVKKGERVFLTFTEYFKPDEYGNLAFLAERLTGLLTKSGGASLLLAGESAKAAPSA